MIFTQERLKVEERLPAARLHPRTQAQRDDYRRLNDVGIIVMGGLTNSVLRALERMELADVFGASRIPVLVLNVVYPLVPEELQEFCGARARCWWSRKVIPTTSSRPSTSSCGGRTSTPSARQGLLPNAENTPPMCCSKDLPHFCRKRRPKGIDADTIAKTARGLIMHKPVAAAALGALPRAPPSAPVVRAASILRHQVDAARAWSDAYRCRHRLPFACSRRSRSATPFSATTYRRSTAW